MSQEKKDLGSEVMETETSVIEESGDMEIEKPKKSKEKFSIGKRIKASFQSRMFRNGGYSTVVIIAVIVIAVFINLFTERLDLKIDMSSEGLYTLTEETQKIANEIKDDITIYYVVQEDYESVIIQEILNRYKKLSKNIKVENRDPVMYPKFVSNYTSEESNNCVIVVNETKDTHKFINYSDMINSTVDYQTYQMTVTDIDVEGQISSALQYVISEDVPVVYQVIGHGEIELNGTLQKNVGKLNVDLQRLTSVSVEEIPEDCDMLLINGPENDFTEEEVAMIEDYLQNGGNATIFVNHTSSDMTNFHSLLAYYGITPVEGIVVEGSGHYMGNYPTYLLPNVTTAHEVVTGVNNNHKNVIMPISTGLLENSVRDTLEFTNFLTSSDDAYSKVNTNSQTVSKEDGDIDGPFYLGVAVEEEYNNHHTKLVVFGSSYMLEEQMIITNQFGNQELLLDSINWMVEHEAGLNIPTKSIEQQYVTVQPAQIGFWAVLLIGVLPVIILAAGIIVWLKRRKA